MKSLINGSDTVVQRDALVFSYFVARKSADILESLEEFAPTVREWRRERIAWKNSTQRAEATAITPSFDEALQCFK